jgi:hypothetical protein
MHKVIEVTKLPAGTLIRHKTTGYQGRIDGITEIKTCFTRGGALAVGVTTKDTFQYRVEIEGEPMRRIAPAEDLEILEGVVDVVCAACGYAFHSKPGVGNKAGGRCPCGGLICPVCLSCQAGNAEGVAPSKVACLKQSARKARKLAAQRKAKRA